MGASKSFINYLNDLFGLPGAGGKHEVACATTDTRIVEEKKNTKRCSRGDTGIIAREALGRPVRDEKTQLSGVLAATRLTAHGPHHQGACPSARSS